MRNYQRKKTGEMYLPHNVYMQVQYKIKDYDRLKKERLDVLYGYGNKVDGMPRGNRIGRPTEESAIRLAYIDDQLAAIDQSAVEMRGRFSKRVYEDFDPIKAYWSYDYFNYIHIRNKESDEGPSRSTWNRFKCVFSSMIAQKLKII